MQQPDWWALEEPENVSDEEGRERGKRNEDRVFTAFCDIETEDVPDWYVAIRRATTGEDHCGIDFVVYANNGDEYLLQVKSSNYGKWDFLYDRLSIPEAVRLVIGIVVVRPNDTCARIRHKVFEALQRAREESISKQEA
jgi:hypothetical protein